MKKQFSTILLLCVLQFGFMAAKAQKETKKFSIGFGFEGGIPLGSSNTSYSFTGGFGIRGSYHLGPGFVTLSTGLFVWYPKAGQGDATKASLQVPIKAGYKYVFHKPFFVMGELGYSMFKIYGAGTNGDIASSNSGGLTISPTVGVNFNAFEAGIKYETNSASGGPLSCVRLRLGFNF